MSKIKMLYGYDGLEIDIDDSIEKEFYQKPDMPILDNPIEALQDSFKNPINCNELSVLCKNKKSACIVICDITRPVPNHLFLQPLIKELINGGIEKEQIIILIATGLHRPNEGEELRSLINDEWVLENISIANHFARDHNTHLDLGRTSTRNTPVKIDKRFLQADLKIVTGLVEPHFMAGYSGGRKVIAPGIAHAETITTFHNFKFMNDPFATSCNFDGNPLHEEQLEIVKMIGEVYAINTVIDEDRNVSFINFGEILASHFAAVEFVKSFVELPATKKYHAVLTSSAGEPLDKTFYQVVKGLSTALGVVHDGGHIIIVANCSEGIGSPEFIESQQRLIEQGPKEFLNAISQKSHASIDEWQTHKLAQVLSACKVYLYCDSMSDEEFVLTGVNRCYSIEDTINVCLKNNSDKQLAIIPEGPYVVPLFKG
ncbi:MAG: hypothetical protein COA79_04655 [Planctomycetota bacterium]|nr:MAG: hypothetical protein COA79_04655 [Planctomycetota bacterium]